MELPVRFVSIRADQWITISLKFSILKMTASTKSAVYPLSGQGLHADPRSTSYPALGYTFQVSNQLIQLKAPQRMKFFLIFELVWFSRILLLWFALRRHLLASPDSHRSSAAETSGICHLSLYVLSPPLLVLPETIQFRR